jgi:hypothetical protein
MEQFVVEVGASVFAALLLLLRKLALPFGMFLKAGIVEMEVSAFCSACLGVHG